MLRCVLILMIAWTLLPSTTSVASPATSTKGNLPVADQNVPRVKMKTQQELNLRLVTSQVGEVQDKVTTVLKDNNSLNEGVTHTDVDSSAKESKQKMMVQKLLMAAQKSSQTNKSKYILMALAINESLVAYNWNYDSNDQVTSGNWETSQSLQNTRNKSITKSTYEQKDRIAGHKHLFAQGHYEREPHYADKNLVIKHNQSSQSRSPYQNTSDRKVSSVSQNEVDLYGEEVDNLSVHKETMGRPTVNVNRTLDKQFDVLERQNNTAKTERVTVDVPIASTHAQNLKEKPHIPTLPVACLNDCQCEVQGQFLELQCTQPPIDAQLRVYFTALSQSVSISKLTITHSGLESVPEAICALTNLTSLDMSHNRIANISHISCLKNLSVFELSYNNVDKLFNHTFKGLSLLERVILRNNRVSYIEVGTFMQPELINLRVVELEYNNLTVVDCWPLKMPSFLHQGLLPHEPVVVNVSFNNIYKLKNTVGANAWDISFFRNIIGVDFSHNNISHIADFDVLALLHVTSWLDIIGAWQCAFLFHNNPLACDCDMYWFVNTLRPFIPFFKAFHDLVLIQIPCHSPPETRGTLIYELPEYMFRCNVKEDCPDGAVCVHTPGNSTITVVNHNHSATALPDVVPQEKHIQLYYENSNINRIEPMGYLKNVTQLIMQNSRIEVIENEAVRMLTGIETLNLKNSAVQRLPYVFMQTSSFPHLSSIDITENPFICDCLSVDFKNWILQQQAIISDVQNIRCNSFPFDNTPVINVPDNLFICGFGTLIVFSVTSLAIILIALLCYILSEYKRRIRLRLLKLFNHNFRLGKTDTERLICHDFIIVVCEEDEDSETVNQFTTTVKSAFPAFKIHTYATLFGQTHFQNLPDIEQSRTLIYLLSKNYLANNYYVYLFRLGLDLFLRYYGSICLVPVLLDSHDALLSTDPIDGDVRTFLSHFKCVDVHADELPRRIEFIMYNQITSLELLKPLPQAFNLQQPGCHDSCGPLIDASGLSSDDQIDYHEQSNLQEGSAYAVC